MPKTNGSRLTGGLIYGVQYLVATSSYLPITFSISDFSRVLLGELSKEDGNEPLSPAIVRGPRLRGCRYSIGNGRDFLRRLRKGGWDIV